MNWFPYSAPWHSALDIILWLHFMTYAFASLIILYSYRKKIKTLTSESVGKNIFYLTFIICDFMFFWSANVITSYLHLPFMNPQIFWTLTVINLFVVANTIVYQGMKFPEIFYDENLERKKYEKNLLTEKEKQVYVNRLKDYMAVKKPYLRPTLSLSDLARELAIPPYILSQVLNVALNQNFYDFVNNYRIEECKNLLLSSTRDGKTMLEILYQSGFNSKSVFNAAFKKYTGMTPREFKKDLQSRSVQNTQMNSIS